MNGEILHGHVLDMLRKIPSESIDCVVTSPPYYRLRLYPSEANVIWGGDPNCEHEWEPVVRKKERGGLGKSSWERPSREVNPGNEPQVSYFCRKCGAWMGQLGLEPTPELYVEHLGLILKEIYRVLKPTGTFWLNIGDSYAGGSGHNVERINPKIGRTEGKPTDSIRPQRNLKGIPRKCMLCIPERVLFKALEVGFIVRNKIIWHKPNALPSSVKDRLTNTYEFVYLLVKKPKYYFNLDAIRKRYKDAMIERVLRFIRNHEKFDESIHKSGDFGGQNPFKVFENVVQAIIKKYRFNYRVREAKKGHFLIAGVKASEEEMQKYDNQGVPKQISLQDLEDFLRRLGKNPGDVWSLTTEPFPEAHFAVFPLKLVVRAIVAGCPSDGTVLDPFLGSGTTALACELLNHKMWDKIPKFEEVVNAEVVKNIDWNLRWIGIEAVSEYVEMAKNRIMREVYAKSKPLAEFL